MKLISGESDDQMARADILDKVTKLSCPFHLLDEQPVLASVKDLKAHIKVPQRIFPKL